VAYDKREMAVNAAQEKVLQKGEQFRLATKKRRGKSPGVGGEAQKKKKKRQARGHSSTDGGRNKWPGFPEKTNRRGIKAIEQTMFYQGQYASKHKGRTKPGGARVFLFKKGRRVERNGSWKGRRLGGQRSKEKKYRRIRLLKGKK